MVSNTLFYTIEWFDFMNSPYVQLFCLKRPFDNFQRDFFTVKSFIAIISEENIVIYILPISLVIPVASERGNASKRQQNRRLQGRETMMKLKYQSSNRTLLFQQEF